VLLRLPARCVPNEGIVFIFQFIFPYSRRRPERRVFLTIVGPPELFLLDHDDIVASSFGLVRIIRKLLSSVITERTSRRQPENYGTSRLHSPTLERRNRERWCDGGYGRSKIY
jgi:hypothetical protein